MRTIIRFKKWLFVLMVLAAWYALMFSSIGDFLAGVTILGLIVILFVCGCINVRQDDDR